MAQTLFTVVHVYQLVDALTVVYRAVRTGCGDGTSGASVAGANIRDICSGLSSSIFIDPSLQTALNASAVSLVTDLNAKKVFSSRCSSFFSAVNQRASLSRTVSSSIVSLDKFMLWYNYSNAGTYWQCMAPPEWRDMFHAIYQTRPNPLNVYFPVIKDGEVTIRNDSDEDEVLTFTNALWKAELVASVATDTLGHEIDETKYAGGFCYVRWTGGGGSGASTITVTGMDQNGDNETWLLSGTWGAGDFTATQTGVVLVPQTNAYSLITKVTDITFSGVTDGTFYVEARPPSGRIYPPA